MKTEARRAKRRIGQCTGIVGVIKTLTSVTARQEITKDI